MILLIIKFISKSRRVTYRFRGCILKIMLTCFGCKVGKRLVCKQWPLLREIPFKNIIIGDDVIFGYRITLIINKNGKLTIGNKVNLTQDIIISSLKSIIIDDYTLIGENVSIRDADHGTEISKPIFQQFSQSDAIKIGKDVWIGAGVRILRGSQISDKVIIGANSIVTKKNITEEGGIYIGNKLQLVKLRN